MAKDKKNVIARSVATKQSRFGGHSGLDPESRKNKKNITNSISDLRKLSVEELQKLLHTARQDLLEAQKSLRANELANPRVISKMKKEIARILTVISEVIARSETTKQSRAGGHPAPVPKTELDSINHLSLKATQLNRRERNHEKNHRHSNIR